MYVFWTADQVKQAIMTIERQITSGVQSVSAPVSGSIQHLSVGRAKAVLEDLYQAYEEKTGTKLARRRPVTGIRTYQIYVDKDRT